MNEQSQKPLPPIRVFIVDDSAFMRMALSRMIALEADIQVVGTAASGLEAVQRIPALNPDVITLDVEMPGLDGVETLRRIMAQFPRPVIMVSSVTLENSESTFNALAAGAFDYVPKQLSSTSLDILHIRTPLISKIRAAAESRRLPAPLEQERKPPRAESSAKPAPRSPVAIVAIGISTGGPKALEEILPRLPRDLPVPILAVQHMPAGFIAPFAERLNKLCALSIREATHAEVVRPGVVYFAPSELHMTVERWSESTVAICLSKDPKNQLHIPSVDIMMQSVARAFRLQAMGVIMTGMGADGAEGMRAIHREGGFTVGQDEASCAVYGMPRVCAEMRVLDKIVTLNQIPYEILQATLYRKSSAG